MREQDVQPLGVTHVLWPQLTDAASGIEDELGAVLARDLHAGGVATHRHGLGPWRGNRAARPPKPDAHQASSVGIGHKTTIAPR